MIRSVGAAISNTVPSGVPRMAVVGAPGAWSSEALADACERNTGHRLLIDPAKMCVDLAAGKVLVDDIDLTTYDVILVKKLGSTYTPDLLDRLEMLRFLQGHGVLIMSPPSSIAALLDRLACTVTLRQHDIPMPETTVTEDINMALSTVKRYGKAVLKPLYSTKARGMRVVNGKANRADAETGEGSDGSRDDGLRAELEAFKNEGNVVFYIQKWINIPGRDLGLAFCGGKFVGAYARVASGDSWNTTIHDGGRYAAVEVDDAMVALAHRAQAPFKLDFTTVDVVETEAGPRVFEVSAFGGFRGLKDGLGIDAAALFVQHAIAQHNTRSTALRVARGEGRAA